MAGKAWTEQHIKELIKASIMKNGSSGGSSDNPDNPNVYSSYNYPILLEDGMNSGKLYFMKNSAIEDSWRTRVYFARPSSVASQFAKISQNRPDFSYAPFNQNILPVGGLSSSALNVEYISKLKTEITGGVGTPSGTMGMFGVITGSPLPLSGGSRYVFMSIPGTFRDFDNDLTALYEKLNSHYASSTGNYYFLSPGIITKQMGFIDLYLILSTKKIAVIRNAIYDAIGEPISAAFHSINISNPVYMYRFTASSISSIINSIKQFFTDNNLYFETYNPVISTVPLSTSVIASATTYRVYELQL